MSVLNSLLLSYEYCEENDLVDNHFGKKAVLLPIYHQSITANKNNVLNVTLDKNGTLLHCSFAEDGEIHCFPVTEDSVARSSNLAPHPIVDKMKYCIKEIGDEQGYAQYYKGFKAFYDYVKNHEVKSFLEAIKIFLDDEYNYDYILAKLPYKDINKVEKGEIEYSVDNGKKKKYNFKDTFICFAVIEDNGNKKSVNNFIELHNEFIKYTDEVLMADCNREVCNISGNEEVITDKHRGLMGNAKVVSVSNKKETYYGRFSNGADIIRIGRKSSEKIHLMLKYFLENENSNSRLDDTLYLVNWFSKDVNNSINFNLTEGPEVDYYDDDDISNPVSGNNSIVGRAFIRGSEKLDMDDSYYAMLVDKSSNGRISIRYYNELQNSQLIANLEQWQEKYVWEKKDFVNNSFFQWVPSLKNILYSAYGIERNGFLNIENGGFKKNQFQNLVIALIEGGSIQGNIKNALAQNIRNRQKYKNTWPLVMRVSLAVLSEGRKEYDSMREIENQTRSYLYGRLLAVYDELENCVLREKDKKINSQVNKSKMRSTNATRFWNSYVNKPETTMKTLDLATKYCVDYMLSSGSDRLTGILIKFEKAKEEIFELLDTEKNRSCKINTPLDSDFIFGYYAQKKDIYTRKENKNE